MMEHADFLVWVLCYPVVVGVTKYLAWASGRVYTDNVHGIAAMISTAVWAGVGWLLY